MSDAALETIRRCFCEVMEKQVFMFPEWRSHLDIPCGEEGFLGATIRFGGPLRGSLLLAMPPEVTRSVAANFLGLDDGDGFADEMASDALKEMLNITCGHVVAELCGRAQVVELSVPEVSALECGRVALLAGLGESLVFDVEGAPVLLRAEFERRPGPEGRPGAEGGP
jgi:chemotaxis protein CheY-P-specific phosphatase CheC